MIVISDTTPIISLIKAGQIDILEKLYGKVFIPEAVYKELTDNALFVDEAKIVKSASYLITETVLNTMAVKILREVSGLDAGESEAIVSYGEKGADLLLIDENKGRKVAKQMGVRHIGTVGLLVSACKEGYITPEEVEKCLDVMRNGKIRLSRVLCNKVLEQVGRKAKY